MNPFDECWDWDEEARTGGESHGHTQKIPAGTHTGDVIEAFFEDSDKPFAIDEAKNPNGTCLVVTWSKPGFYPVKARVPKHWRGKIEAICRACAVACPQRGVAWSEESLVGRVATVTVEYKVDAQGKEWDRITNWHPSPSKPQPAAPAKRPPARTPAAKAHQEFTAKADADDIPF